MFELPIVFVRCIRYDKVGYDVRDRKNPEVSYGFVWDHRGASKWVATYPDARRGHERHIPGLANRTMAGLFLYRYNKPVPTGRPETADGGRGAADGRKQSPESLKKNEEQ
ncbi:hypothetical protein [Streptomyces sp. NPDC093149]|uniref:hypothetical protein n=1 Tax=Streptomyces sp. NPDC093149 TaxID=3366031 RepID=UPI003804E141